MMKMHQSGMVRLEKYQFTSFESILIGSHVYSFSCVCSIQNVCVLYDAGAKVVNFIEKGKNLRTNRPIFLLVYNILPVVVIYISIMPRIAGDTPIQAWDGRGAASWPGDIMKKGLPTMTGE